MSETTARLGLPYILPGQAQKEVFHNEALVRLDTAVAPAVKALSNVPPSTPQEGECWIVGANPAGEWAGHGNALACWTAGGWRFVLPLPGMLVWKESEQFWVHWNGSAWSDGQVPASAVVIAGKQVLGPRQPSLLSPSGGTIIDAECRAAVGAVIATLKSHGLIE